MSNQEVSKLYEIYSKLSPELQKEFFRQLELSQSVLREKLLAEVDQIKSYLQELNNPSISFKGQNKIPFRR